MTYTPYKPKQPESTTPTLTFDLAPWTHLVNLFARSETEIGCWAITLPDDPLHIVDILFCKQESTSASFDLDMVDCAERMEALAISGVPPQCYSRILIHNHPFNSPTPSTVDWSNFRDLFVDREYPWGCMLIISKDLNTSCNFHFLPPGLNAPQIVEGRVLVSYAVPQGGTILDPTNWYEPITLVTRPVARHFAAANSAKGLSVSSKLSPAEREELRKKYARGNAEAIDKQCRNRSRKARKARRKAEKGKGIITVEDADILESEAVRDSYQDALIETQGDERAAIETLARRWDPDHKHTDGGDPGDEQQLPPGWEWM